MSEQPQSLWTEADDHCSNCSASIDPMNSDAISGLPYGLHELWCGIECVEAWTAKRKAERA